MGDFFAVGCAAKESEVAYTMVFEGDGCATGGLLVGVAVQSDSNGAV